jgi:hypothetical protein
MTGKALRELARTTLAKQIQGDTCDPGIVHACVQALSVPMDPDEEREAQRLHIDGLNALSPVAGLGGNIGKQFGS